MRKFFTFLSSLVIFAAVQGQTDLTANFILPDTTCVGNPVTITNLTAGGSTYYWNFCSGNTTYSPTGVNIGNPGNKMNAPTYIAIAKDGNTCYSFVSNQGNQSVTKINYGSSFLNTPISSININLTGYLNDSAEAIQVKFDNNTWYGFVCNNNRLIRLNFGTSLSNNPTISSVGPFPSLVMMHGLIIQKEGNNWIGVATCSLGNKVVRFNFGNSLGNTATMQDLTVTGYLNLPGPVSLVQDATDWYAFVVNNGNSKLLRLNFGSSLLNAPTWTDLGVVCNSNAMGIMLIRDCGVVNGFMTRYLPTTTTDLMWRLNLPGGLSGPITTTPIGNIGSLDKPVQFSDITRIGDTLYSFICNRANFTITRFSFPSCTNSSIPSSTQFNPPTYSYNAAGTYNVTLLVDEGLPTQATVCKSIVVLPNPCTISASFLCPDTVCVGEPVTITNLTSGGSTYYWNFCSGNANQNPTGLNIGNPGNLLDIPTYITLVKEGSDCYSFISCQGVGVVRYYHGNSFKNNPVSWTNLGTFGMIDFSEEGIQVKKDNGTWYAIVCSNTTLVRLNFGSSPSNTPTATNIGPFPGLVMLHGLSVLQEGTTWIAYATCSTGNDLVRFNFGNSLANIPTMTNFGALPGFSSPGPICPVFENGLWYLLVMGGNNTLSRITLGTSLLNTPTGVSLGNPGGFNFALGLMVIRDCGSTVGYWCNYINPGQLGKLTFTGGVAGTVTGQVLGNIGNLNQPHCFSELFRQNDTLYAYITNRPGTLTRLTFPPCTNSSVPSSTAFNPPVYSYNSPGTYNVSLLVDEGLPTQGTACQTITVMAPPVVNLGPNISLCQGVTATLNAGPGFSSYLWSTGATSQSIMVATAGSFWVKVTKYGCEDYDTIAVTYFPSVSLNLGPDTIVCQGSSYTFNAGACAGCSYLWGNLTTGNPNIGTGSTYTTGTAGTYMVTKTDANGCVKRDTATLSTTPVPSMTLFPLSGSICSGSTTNILLTANLPGTTFTWTATLVSGIVTGFSGGTGSVIAQTLTNPGTIQGVVNYTITPHKGSCTGSPVIYAMTVKPAPIVTNNPASDSLCSGGTTNVVLQSSVPGSTFAWTATASSPDVTGYSGGSGPVITQTLFNSGSSLQIVNYQVVASALGCNSPPMIYKMFVKPIPDLVITPDLSAICPLSLTNVMLSSGVTGTNFSWIASGSSPMVSGYFDGSGNLISQFLYNTGFSTETVIYSVTPEAAGCLGLTDTATIRVNPTPDVSASPQFPTICSGGVTGIGLSSSVTGTTYSWTCTASSGSISGFLDGSGYSIAQQLFNSGSVVGSVTYQVIAAANGCPGDTTLCVVNVNPLPTATFSPPSLAVCSGSNTGIQLSSPVAGTLLSWTCSASSPNISGFYPGSGTMINDMLQNSGYTSEIVTYTISSIANGCSGIPVTYPVTVYPVPDVNFNPLLQSLCSGNFTNISLSGDVAGTTFTWSAVAGSPLVTGFSDGTGILIHQQLVTTDFVPGTVAYVVIPTANGCAGITGSTVVTIEPKPVVTFPACFDTITLLNAKPFILKGATPPGGIYSGPGVNSATGIFSPALAGTGFKQVTYTYAMANGCSSSSLLTIKVIAPAPFTCGNTLTDIRTGQTYPTVLLTGQCWMASSLDYGTNISSMVPQRDNCLVEKYCYDDMGSNCLSFGALYQWDELMTYTGAKGGQGICPPAWHVPSESEWNTLFSLYINNAFAGKPLLYTGYSGFNNLLAGSEFFNKNWNFAGFATLLWSSDAQGPFKAWAHGMNNPDYSVSYYPSFRSNAFYVRCLKD